MPRADRTGGKGSTMARDLTRLENEAAAEAAQANESETSVAEPTEGKTSAKGGKRAPIETGVIVVNKAADQSDPRRASRMDSDPVSLAVKEANKGEWYELKAETPDKVRGIKALLRRAAQFHGVGINIDPRDLGEVVRFKTADRRERAKPVKPEAEGGKPGEGEVSIPATDDDVARSEEAYATA